MKKYIDQASAAKYLYYSGVLFLFGMLKKYLGKNKVIIFTGHRVINDSPDNKIDLMSLMSGQGISDIELSRRLGVIMKYYNVGDPQDLASNDLQNCSFYLTFDDGYTDNIKYAKPVLDKLGIKAVIFVIAHVLRNPCIVPWWDKYGEDELNNHNDVERAKASYSLRCGDRKVKTRGLTNDAEGYSISEFERYFDTNQVFSEDETFYYANHTSTHANLCNLTKEEIASELDGCSAMIKDSPRYLPLLAFPFGAYNENVLDKAKSMAEINMAFSTGRGSDVDPYCLKRINLNTLSYQLFYADLVGIFPFLSAFKKMLRLSNN